MELRIKRINLYIPLVFPMRVREARTNELPELTPCALCELTHPMLLFRERPDGGGAPSGCLVLLTSNEIHATKVV